MFGTWKDDCKKLKRGFEHELSFWRVSKFIKQPAMYDLVYGVIMNNFQLLKDLFIVLTSTSNYPTLTWLDFQSFISQLNIVGQ